MPFELKLLLTLATYGAVLGMMASYASLMATLKKKGISPVWIKWSSFATFLFFLTSFISEKAIGMVLSKSGQTFPVFERAFSGFLNLLTSIKGELFLLLLGVSFVGAVCGYIYSSNMESNLTMKRAYVVFQACAFILGAGMSFLIIIMPAK